MKTDQLLPILGFGLAGYRSFGPDLQSIGPCQKINLLIGQNNSGKSNILRFLHDHYPKLSSSGFVSEWEFEALEQHRATETFPILLSLAVRVTGQQVDNWVKQALSRGHVIMQQSRFCSGRTVRGSMRRWFLAPYGSSN